MSIDEVYINSKNKVKTREFSWILNFIHVRCIIKKKSDAWKLSSGNNSCFKKANKGRGAVFCLCSQKCSLYFWPPPPTTLPQKRQMEAAFLVMNSKASISFTTECHCCVHFKARKTTLEKILLAKHLSIGTSTREVLIDGWLEVFFAQVPIYSLAIELVAVIYIAVIYT